MLEHEGTITLRRYQGILAMRRISPRSLFARIALAFLLAPCIHSPAFAEWAENGIPVCADADGDHAGPAIAPDGSGGFVAAWVDHRLGSSVYARRIDGYGHAIWAAGGLCVCAAGVGEARAPIVVPDGDGGAIVVWRDSRNGNEDLYAQRIDRAGIVRWALNGAPVCAAAGDQTAARAIPDGAGGAIVAWVDARSGGADIYAARLLPDGSAPWGENGLLVCGSSGNQYGVDLAPDGLRGAFLAWSDPRGSYHAIYAQWIDANGVPHWTLNGLPVAPAAYNQVDPRAIADGAGGFVVCWAEYRATGYDLFAQRMNLYRMRLWSDAGVAVCAAPDRQRAPRLASDGSCGAILAWEDERGDTTDIYAQRVDSSGVMRWAANGVPVCAATGAQRSPSIVPDGGGGAVVSWADGREEAGAGVYAQRVDPEGLATWTADGAPLCANAWTADPHPCMATDGGGGCFAAWEDLRDGAFLDVYAQRMDASGAWGYATPVAPPIEAPCLAQNYPNPFNPSTRIEFILRSPAVVRLAIHDVSGRLVRVLADGERDAGAYSVVWDGRNDSGTGTESGIYFCRLEAGAYVASRKIVLLK